MFTILRQSILLTLVFAVLLCGLYPLAVTGLGQALFPWQANGSMLHHDGKTIGSVLIGQHFTKPEYFHGRLSAAGNGYDAMASGGSNLGPTSAVLANRLSEEAGRLRSERPDAAALPIDLLTASGSGLDPHITSEAALFQVARVAKARGVTPQIVAGLVRSKIEGPDFILFGPVRVNVLELNLALDDMQP